MRSLFIVILGLLPFIACADNPQADSRRSASIDESLLQLQDTDDFIGNKNSKVTIIEYSSLNCPHCKQFHMDIFKKLKKDYIDTNKILFIYRDFPTNKVALSGSRLAHCKGKTEKGDRVNATFHDLILSCC
jgi:protein-disulfide isomerase